MSTSLGARRSGKGASVSDKLSPLIETAAFVPVPTLLLRYRAWLLISEQELVLILHILDKRGLALRRGQPWPWISMDELVEATGRALRSIRQWKASLIGHGYLRCRPLGRQGGGRGADEFDLSPLFAALEYAVLVDAGDTTEGLPQPCYFTGIKHLPAALFDPRGGSPRTMRLVNRAGVARSKAAPSCRPKEAASCRSKRNNTAGSKRQNTAPHLEGVHQKDLPEGISQKDVDPPSPLRQGEQPPAAAHTLSANETVEPATGPPPLRVVALTSSAEVPAPGEDQVAATESLEAALNGRTPRAAHYSQAAWERVYARATPEERALLEQLPRERARKAG